MLDKNNIVAALLALGFELTDNVYEKYFPYLDCKLIVDLVLKKIYYPNGFERGFDHNEDFVVLECVNRLLEKGYRPEHIELEKKWRVGHGASGGRADICVKRYDTDKTLFIIECKTAGQEYDAALDKMKLNGGQLFSYWQQTRECNWLVLYSSDFVNGTIKYRSESVDCSGAEYRRAATTDALFKTWSKKYEQKFSGDVIFSPESAAYRINEPPLYKKSLVDFEENNRIINRFEEILRHNNVSDKENAFNRLTALFISKLADESSKADDAEVEFQYKIGTDNYYSLNDRLLRLYSEGMQYFMREDIFYLPNDYVEKMLGTYKAGQRNHLINELNSMVRSLKFFTNNEFAFKEIHNEKLFLQNGKILKEVVQLFERYRIIGAKNLQLLGDLFEQLLNKGFKQNEGQFFTPIPLTRFIWDCLPLEKIIRVEGGKIVYPRIVDYACGAGHFLTQGFEAINDCVRAELNVEPDPAWVDTKLYGVEKDYRLSRVSRISLFMHGAGGGNIIFGDGLDNHMDLGFEKNIRPGRFDILTANPPYAVAAFKPHLNEETQSNFTTLDKISDDGSEIETLFVERTAQLLKPLGVAAIILPSSILNKDNGSFVAARTFLLRWFKIRAIVRLGSKTFGATGTNTVIFFLQKFDEPLRRELAVADSVDAIFDWRERLGDWEDKDILDAWLSKLDITADDYKAFVLRAEPFEHWKAHSYFGQYYEAFVDNGIYAKKIAQPSFKKLSPSEQIDELKLLFYNWAHPIEREKLWTFGCTYNQTTLIVTAPDDNKGQETFLGYKWSNRKGAEGMQTIKAGGLLYDPNDRRAENTIAALVRASFDDRELYSEALKDYCYWLPTHEMLNFNAVDFKKGITVARPTFTPPTYIGEYPLVKLSAVASFATEKIPVDNINLADYISTDNMIKDKGGVAAYDGSPQISSVTRYVVGDILVSNIRPYLKKIWFADKSGGCSNDVLVFRSIGADTILPKYLFIVLENDMFFNYVMSTARGIKMPRGEKDQIMEYELPLPPLDVQRSIVAEFDGIDERLRAEDRIIADADNRIDAAFNELVNKHFYTIAPLEKLFDIQLGRTPSRSNITYWDDKDFKWISVADMGRYDLFTNETEEYISRRAVEETGMKCVPAGTVIMSFKLTIGRTAITSEDIYTNEAIAAFIDKKVKEIEPIYLKFYLEKNEWATAQLNAVKGMTLNKNSIGQTTIKIPPLELQREFSALVRSLDEKKSVALEHRRLLLADREAIIKRHFR